MTFLGARRSSGWVGVVLKVPGGGKSGHGVPQSWDTGAPEPRVPVRGLSRSEVCPHTLTPTQWWTRGQQWPWGCLQCRLCCPVPRLRPQLSARLPAPRASSLHCGGSRLLGSPVPSASALPSDIKTRPCCWLQRGCPMPRRTVGCAASPPAWSPPGNTLRG